MAIEREAVWDQSFRTQERESALGSRGGQIEPNLILIGVNSRTKQRRMASTLARDSEEFDREVTCSRLKEIRQYALANQDHLINQFIRQASMQEHCSVHSAKDARGAVDRIARIMGDSKVLAINQADVINELRPHLERRSFNLIHTYLASDAIERDTQKLLTHYWQLPVTSHETALASFNIQPLRFGGDRKDYTALLGISAASSEDGSVCFLQHTANIGAMLQEAQRIILLVGIEKVVRSRMEAIFQTKCMGALGLESMILDLDIPSKPLEDGQQGDISVHASPPEIHIIMLDNGRRELARNDQFSTLLTCIGCRACAKSCPTHRFFDPAFGRSPKSYLWSHLLDINPSLEFCMGCGWCVQQCPLDIDIPHLIRLQRSRGLLGWRHLMRNRLFQDTSYLMQGAHLFAWAINRAFRNKSFRILVERLIGLQRNAWIPRAQGKPFLQSDEGLKHKNEGLPRT